MSDPTDDTVIDAFVNQPDQDPGDEPGTELDES